MRKNIRIPSRVMSFEGFFALPSNFDGTIADAFDHLAAYLRIKAGCKSKKYPSKGARHAQNLIWKMFLEGAQKNPPKRVSFGYGISEFDPKKQNYVGIRARKDGRFVAKKPK